MGSEVKLLYLNLDNLLKEICTFLSDEKRLSKLSLEDKKMADLLIKKSKDQLQAIARVSSPMIECDGAYVDMEPKKVIDDDSTEMYSCPDETTVEKSNTVYDQLPECPFKDMPAKELNHDIKYGYINWKTKIFLFEKLTRIYAGIHGQWLLIYSNEKDMKPTQTFNLQYYEAKAIEDNSLCFEMKRANEEKRAYFFKAQTHKDMLQWVAKINRCHDVPLILSKLSDLPQTEELQTYDAIENIEEDPDDVYLEIENVLPPERLSNRIQTPPPPLPKEDHPPALPSRRQRTLPEIPVESPEESESESLASYDDVGEPPKNCSTSLNSFSEDEEDDTYESFVPVRAKVQALKNAKKISGEPPPPRAPKAIIAPKPPVKPLPTKKPTIDRRRIF